MDCSELITSEEYMDFIIDNNLRFFGSSDNKFGDTNDSCVLRIDDRWSVGYGKLPPDLSFSISDLGYYTIPKLYGLVDTSSMSNSGVIQVLEQTALDAKGQGIIVGFVDTGIDYSLDTFNDEFGNTRIAAIWDQTVKYQNLQDKENDMKLLLSKGVSYGTVYTKEEINKANKEENIEKNSIITKDENGHGTYMAAIAAGRGNDEFQGVAPESTIVMVKLKAAKKYLRDFYRINDNVEAYEETDIMTGIRFLLLYASIVEKPLVICVGVGTTSGAHIGKNPLANVLEQAAGVINTAVVVAMGNEANERTHISGTVDEITEGKTIELNIGENEKGFVVELWASTLDVLSISIISPSGEGIPRIPAKEGKTTVINYVLENTRVEVDYKVVETLTGYELIFIKFISPAAGIWRIKVYSIDKISGVFNAWLPLRKFLSSPDTFFLASTPDITLTEPSCDPAVISVGSYNHNTDATDINSGRGYNPLGLVKPDLVAPGVDVYVPRGNNEYFYKSGTSIAAAHVAGAAAIIFSWAVTNGNSKLIGNNEVRFFLTRGCKRNVSVPVGIRSDYPNNVTGYGKLDLLNSFLQLRIS